jgi:DNA-binding winged helix-turn-helix (wHTH) protein
MSTVWLVGTADSWMDDLHLELSGAFSVRRIGSLKNVRRICSMTVSPEIANFIGLFKMNDIKSLSEFYETYLAFKKIFPNGKIFFLQSDAGCSVEASKAFDIPVLNKSIESVQLIKLLNRNLEESIDTSVKSTANDRILLGDLEIDRASSSLKVLATGYKEFLTPIEIKILYALYSAANFKLSRHELIERAWHGIRVSDSTVDSHISRLRKKMEKSFECTLNTIYGEGWTLAIRESSR